MVRFRERKRSIRTFSDKRDDQIHDKDTGTHIKIGRINRDRYPKLKAWYFIIILFLGLMYLIAKGFASLF